MSNTGELEVDMLFLGLTRPSMLFGVTYTVVMAYFLVLMMIFVMTANIVTFLAIPVCHLVGYFFTQKEPLFVELFMIRQQKCNKCKNRFYHGMTNSYDVL